MIIVFGAISMNLSMEVESFPENKSCVLGDNYVSEAGGKAVNQAMAATRSGGKVALVGKIGSDEEGHIIIDNIRKHGVLTSGIGKSEEKQTSSMISIRDKDGNSYSFYVEGANGEIEANQVPDEILKKGNLLMLQMDISMEENTKLIERAANNGCQVMLNLSPYKTVSGGLLKLLDYLVINSSDLDMLSEAAGGEGKLDPLEVAKTLSKEGNLDCIITMGKEGALCVTKKGEIWKSKALEFDEIIDHAGASDVFCGTLASSLHAGKPFLRAFKRAVVAASMTCMGHGGISSFPYRDDVNTLINELEDPVKL